MSNRHRSQERSKAAVCPSKRAIAARASRLAAIAATLAVAQTAQAVPRPHVSIYFVRGEQLASVARPGVTPLDAVRQLLAGPSAKERTHGYRTYIPRRTRVRKVSVADGVATVDLSPPFAGAGSAESMLARLSQLVRTLAGTGGRTKIQLLIDGAPVAGMFPGISTSSPISLAFLEKPNIDVPTEPREKLPPPDPGVATAQRHLIALGYLVKGDDDGRFGQITENAILAFQKWERLRRTGLLDRATRQRLATAVRPTPLRVGLAGKRAEILLDRQVALLIDDDVVVRTIAVSTGKPSTPTPPGDYRVYAKIRRWWSVPFREWLPYALPFVGGIAFHEFADVPAYPASHGCVRQAAAVASWTYGFAYVGMPVSVIARS